MQNPPPAGKHVAWARFRLAEAFHQSGNVAAARMELEDLLKMISAPVEESGPLAAELAGDHTAARQLELVLPETGVCSTDIGGSSCCTTPPATATPAAEDAACCTPLDSATGNTSCCTN